MQKMPHLLVLRVHVQYILLIACHLYGIPAHHFYTVMVKAEYYWGTRCWWIFLLLGIGGTAASVCIDNILLSALLGVFAFSSFWTIKEIFEQEERVKKGWFPKNPKRTYKF